MTRISSGSFAALSVITLALASGGCGDDPGAGQAGQAPAGPVFGPGSGAPGGRGPGDRAVSTPGIRQIMGKLTKGQNSLTEVIGKELQEAQPAWETIQAQMKEYVQLVGDLPKYNPPKGTKESWAELTAAYADSAGDLDRSVRAKDKAVALTAHSEIKNSCTGCHRQHRVMGPGRGGPPGFGPSPGYPGARKGGLGGPPPGEAPPPGGSEPEGPPPRAPGDAPQ
jgi:hypothetical protein